MDGYYKVAVNALNDGTRSVLLGIRRPGVSRFPGEHPGDVKASGRADVSGPVGLLRLETIVLGLFAPHIFEAAELAVRVHKVQSDCRADLIEPFGS